MARIFNAVQSWEQELFLPGFWFRQFKNLRQGGLKSVIRKVGVLFRIVLPFLLMMPFGLLVTLIIRLMSPLVVIRLYSFHSNRIGHWLGNTELHLADIEAGTFPGRSAHVFYYETTICNGQLNKMWKRVMSGIPNVFIVPFILSGIVRNAAVVNGFFKGAEKYTAATSDRDLKNHYAKAKVRFAFTREEEEMGGKELGKLAPEVRDTFVCMTARDGAYLKMAEPAKDYGYHSYRDSDIMKSFLAAEELTKRGYTVFRVGSAVNGQLPSVNDQIIDYVNRGRTEFMDIYLGSHCRFFIGAATGLTAVPLAFRKPIVWVNFIPFSTVQAWVYNALVIPKKIWVKDEKRFLTFREIVESGVGLFMSQAKYDERGLMPVENSPEEIAEVVLEMHERLDGTWLPAPEDDELQRRFWSYFTPDEWNRTFAVKVGAGFLRANRELVS